MAKDKNLQHAPYHKICDCHAFKPMQMQKRKDNKYKYLVFSSFYYIFCEVFWRLLAQKVWRAPSSVVRAHASLDAAMSNLFSNSYKTDMNIHSGAFSKEN